MAGNLEEWTADTYESGHERNPGDGSAYIWVADNRWAGFMC